MLKTRQLLFSLAIAAGLTRASNAQQTTTVITHGFQFGSTSKPGWERVMASAIAARGGGGSVYRYETSTGRWLYLSGAGTNVIVLTFNWAAESDAAGWGYAEGAADALYAALSEPAGDLAGVDVLNGRILHLIGHSRGCCVNSEVSRRLLASGATPEIDQVTTLDPHPVNGSLCNWGDTTPVRWTGVTWADNYYRQDGGGACDIVDPDGLFLADAWNAQLSALDQGSGCIGHTRVHTWYHGTIDTAVGSDGDCTINLNWYVNANPANPACDTRSCQGFYYAFLGGGGADRPALTGGGSPPGAFPIIYNGGFFNGGDAGWAYHGGGGNGVIAASGYLTLTPSQTRRHNRFQLPQGARTFRYDYRARGSGNNGVLITLDAADGSASYTLENLNASGPGNWVVGHTLTIPGAVLAGRVYTLTFRGQAGTVDIDNIELAVACEPCDTNCDGSVNQFDIQAFINTILTNSGCSPCAADANGDGSINQFDVQDFVACMGG